MSKRSLSSLELLLRPFSGGEGEGPPDGGAGADSKPDEKPAGKPDDTDDDDDDDDDDLKNITDPNQRRVIELSREAGKHRRERNAQRKRADALQAELDAKNNAGGSEKEQWEAEKKQLEQKYSELESKTSNSILRNSIVEEAKYSWYDVPVVMGLINRDVIEIDLEEGLVDGLDAELKRIAKEKPYLVKKGPAGGGNKNNEEGESNGSSGAGANGSTGNQPSGRPNSNDAKAAQRATLMKQYPSLNVR
jgi:hypothetical protein